MSVFWLLRGTMPRRAGKTTETKKICNSEANSCMVFNAALTEGYPSRKMGEEITNIACCASRAVELESLVTVVREAGAWSIVPIEWPNASALVQARTLASAFLLHSGSTAPGPCDELIGLLKQRPDPAPLTV